MRWCEHEIYGIEHLGAAEVIEQLQSVTSQSITEVVHRYLKNKPLAATLAGPLNGHVKLFQSASV